MLYVQTSYFYVFLFSFIFFSLNITLYFPSTVIYTVNILFYYTFPPTPSLNPFIYFFGNVTRSGVVVNFIND